MKQIIPLLPVFVILFFFAGVTDVSSSDRDQLAFAPNASPICDTVPELNQKIVELVRQQIGKKVDRGECWDLAALVLNQTGAEWDGQYNFGKKVDPEKECIYPGDIIQFEGVRIKYTRERAVYEETMGHHTAVIIAVKSKGVFVLAHQNTGFSGRTVGLSDLDLSTIIKGKFQIFRPEL
jgi:hypothetical protein